MAKINIEIVIVKRTKQNQYFLCRAVTRGDAGEQSSGFEEIVKLMCLACAEIKLAISTSRLVSVVEV